MKQPWSSFWYLTGRKALSRSSRGWWTGITEVSIASALVLTGVVLLVGFLTVNFLSPVPDDFYSWLLNYFVKPLLSVVMTGLGIFMMFKAIWQVVGVSAERRGALQANQAELLSEISRGGDLPNVPARQNSPQKGQRLPYRIMASRQSMWGLVTAGVLWLTFLVIVAILVVTAYVKFKMGRDDWMAAGGVCDSDSFRGDLVVLPLH